MTDQERARRWLEQEWRYQRLEMVPGVLALIREVRAEAVIALARGLADAFERDGKPYSAACIRAALEGRLDPFTEIAEAIRSLPAASEGEVT